MVNFIDEPFDDEERQLMEDVEASDDVRLPPEEEKSIREKVAAIAATKGISLRIRDADLAGFKARAEKAGLPYQTLINSVLHRYLTGELVPRESL